MMLRFWRDVLSLCFFVIIVVLEAGCASYTDQIKLMRQDYANHKYQQALEKLEKSPIKTQQRNRLLYLMEKSIILDRLGDKKESRSLLLRADSLADELYTMSISKEALTYVYNESAQEYSGEDYEKVAIHIMLALSFLEEKDYNAALVEARKINNKLSEINSRYDKGKNRYSEDAFARYLSGIIYESQGQIDSAIIDYTKALELYEGIYSKEFGVSVPEQLIEALYYLLIKRDRMDKAKFLEKSYPKVCRRVADRMESLKHMGTLVVIHEMGSIAIKETMDFIVRINDKVIRFSFPVIKPNQNVFSGTTGVRVHGHFYDSSLIQDMDLIASKTLEDRRLRLILKQGARLVIKNKMQDIAEQSFGIFGYVAANVYNVVTETADTRGWTLLPSKFYVSRINLKPNKYKIQIISNDKLVEIKEVDIKPSHIQIIRSIYH